MLQLPHQCHISYAVPHLADPHSIANLRRKLSGMHQSAILQRILEWMITVRRVARRAYYLCAFQDNNEAPLFHPTCAIQHKMHQQLVPYLVQSRTFYLGFLYENVPLFWRCAHQREAVHPPNTGLSWFWHGMVQRLL